MARRLGCCLEVHGLAAGDDVDAVEGCAGERRGPAPVAMMTCCAVISLVPSGEVILTRWGAEQLADAGFALDFVFAEEVVDSAAEFIGDAAAAGDEFGEVDGEVGVGDAVLAGAGAELADESAVVEQGLGGDAAPVQAGAAEGFALDAEDALFELPGADGGGVTRGAAANYDDVVLIVTRLGACGATRAGAVV